MRTPAVIESSVAKSAPVPKLIAPTMILRESWLASRDEQSNGVRQIGRPVREAGVPLRDVQEAAAHANPGTTMRQSGHAHR